MKFQDNILLNDQTWIPNFGFGCWNAFHEEIKQAVMTALSCGYRYIDSAARYGNEEDVGQGIKGSSIPRDKLYLLSKLWPLDFDSPISALNQTLSDLKVDFVNCYLIHWPGPDASRRHRAIETLLPFRGQKFQTLGVSNFQIEHLQEFHKQFGFYPAINQIELHPFYQERELTTFCKEHNIVCIAWGPLYRARGMENPTITRLAEQYQKAKAQILLRWHLQKGHIPIPKSQNPTRIQENCSVFDFYLDASAMKDLDALDANLHIGANPYIYNGEINK